MKIIRISIVVFIFVAGCLLIAKIFWEQELKYTRPTPVPDKYVAVPVNQRLDQNFELFRPAEKPRHLHFYNPACPCSKFNLTHFSSLVKKYQQEIDFFMVLPTDEHLETVEAEFGGVLTVLVDADEALAEACGVYATPQAVIIDAKGKLYYRGNYNKTRYCTNSATNYAQLAIDSLLAHKPAPHLGVLATTAYGCELGEQNWLSSFAF